MVKLGCVKSDCLNLSKGAPQGSVIYLLNIFILCSPVTKICILPWRPVDKIYIQVIAKQHVFIIWYKND